ncbi:DUF943 family protein [Mixta calida]|uniref:DUF943 family protein n=1 Tax=Mixta calida TaxID=665913 RepID=UPI00403AA393
MKIVGKKIRWAILTIVIASLCLFLWLNLRPIKVIAVHKFHDYQGFSAVLVNHFPLTARGKIEWWKKNKKMLKSRYGIPDPAPYGSYTITFWLFGDGYRARDKYDRLCFTDMKNQQNCVEKNKVFTVSYSEKSGLYFLANNGYYRVKDNGGIIKPPTN